MEFRIDRGGFSPLGEVGRYSSSRTQKVSGGFRQSFDQIQFSGQPAGMQGRVQDGLYSVDPGQIAARMLLQGKD